MRPRISRRALRRTLAVSTALTAALCAVLWLILYTGIGTNLVLRYVRARLAPTTTIGSVEGSLRGPLRIVGVRYVGEAVRVTVDSIRLEWRLSALLRRTLDVTTLRASGTRIELLETGSRIGEEGPAGVVPTQPPAFQLPVRVALADVVLSRVELISGSDANSSIVDSVSAAARTAGDTIYIDRVEIFGERLYGKLLGFVQTSGSYPLGLEYEVETVARELFVVGRGNVAGDLHHAETRQEITRPIRAELHAEFDSLLTARSFTASGTVAEFNLTDIDSSWTAVRLGGEFQASGSIAEFRTHAVAQIADAMTGPASARISISRAAEAWQFDSVAVSFLDHPARLTLTGMLELSDGDPKFDGQFGWSGLGWPMHNTQRIISDGRVSVVGNLEDYRLEGGASLWGPKVPRGEFSLDVSGGRDSLTVAGSGEVLGGELNAVGGVVLHPGFEWSLGLEANGLDASQLMSDTAIAIQNIDIAARALGSITDTGLVGKVDIARISGLVRDVPFSLTAVARLQPDRVLLDSMNAEALEGSFESDGVVAFRPTLEGEISLLARDINPAALIPDSAEWHGALSARALVEVRLTPDGVAGRLDLDSLEGLLRSQPLQGQLHLAVLDREYSIDSLSLEWGTLSASAWGNLGRQLRGHIDVDAPDLSIAVPRGTGALRASIEVEGERSSPTISATISGSSLSYDDFQFERLSAAGGIDLSPEGLFDFSVDAGGVILLGRTVDEMGLRLTGERNDHQIESWLRGRSVVTVTAAGALRDTQWIGAIEDIEFVDSTAGTWQLGRAVELELSRDSSSVNQPICLLSGEARACASGSWRRGGSWWLSGAVDSMPIERLAALLPDHVTATGTLSAFADFRAGDGGALDGLARVSADKGQLLYQLRRGAEILSYDRGSLVVESGDGGVSAQMDVVFRRPGIPDSTSAYVDGRLELPDYRPLTDSLGHQPIEARLRLRLTDLSALETAFPQLTDVAGELDADFTASGTVAEPALVGEARLTQGSAYLPALGLELRDIQFTAQGEGGAGIRLSGSVQSGMGSLSAEGTASLSSSADSLLGLRISGERLQVANTPEAQVWVSPELDVTAYAGVMVVEGEVLVPRAVVELREIPAMAVPVSRDVILVGDTVQDRPTAPDVHARVRLVVGDSVSFRGFGFSGRPSGSLLATEEPGQPTSATGQLTVTDGRYRAYGQDLTIETGRVIYAGGPIDNPGLEVRAVRHARDDVTAGLEVKGTLKSPEVTVFSEPPMMQSEALAYLLLGRPLTELSSSEGNRVSNAAISLGLSGGNLLAQRVSRRFGIDEAGIETRGSWEQASLYAGKYLSPRLYVSYGYGLFESSSLFRVRYILSRRWTLQAETGERTSTDIQFRIERGR